MPAADLIKNALELRGQLSLSLIDLRQQVWDVLLKFPDSRDEILGVLDNRPQRTLRDFAKDCRNSVHLIAEQVTDLHQLRATAPLQPGTRLSIGGGYTSAYNSPIWLGGREFYLGAFVDFLPAAR